MKAEIIAVGTEILLGDILNTNAQYLSKALAAIGITVYYQSVVGDNPERLKNAYQLAFSRSDLVITTGGLGPTGDDLTKEVGGEFFNRKSILHEDELEKIERYFKKQNLLLNEGNKKQAYFPEGAIILNNNFGTAPGCIVKDNNKILINLPGPPREMIPMFESYVSKYLKKFASGVIYSKVLRVCGLAEGHMEDKIKDIIDRGTNPTIAPYAKNTEVILRITSNSETEEEAKEKIIPIENQIRERLGQNIYAEGNVTMEEVVAKILIEKNLTISVAESCTGGLIAAKLINYPGISSVFKEGVVTYSNESKVKRLGVLQETLNKYGAVSEQVAKEMAQGISKTCKTNIGLSVTGIAGPGGGTDLKPVGLVYLGLYINGEVKVKKLSLNGDRKRVREVAAVRALDWLRRELINSN